MIAETTGELFLSTLVSDRQGQVHLVYVDQPADTITSALYYTRWDGYDWLRPVDVLIDPESTDPNQPRAVIDEEEILHVVWGGGNRQLRYARVALSQAEFPRAWSPPATIIQALPSSHDLLVALDGRIYLVYSDDTNGAIRVMASMDRGLSWGGPVLVAEPDSGTMASDARLATDSRGRLHAVWTEYTLPDGWPPSGAFYSRSTDGGITWSRKLQVATAGHGQIGVATGPDDGVHLVWRSTVGGDGTFHQYSSDAGMTWSSPDRSDDGGGFSGLPSFAQDSAGTLHYVIGPGYYARWSEGFLTAYEDVCTAPVRALAEKSNGEQTLLAITDGNRLHVVFETDFNAVWYTSLELGLQPLPRATARPTASPTAIAESVVPDPASTAMAVQTRGALTAEENSVAGSGGTALMIAVIPVLVLVGTVAAIAVGRRRRRHVG